jgi:hypothetical protein
MCQGRNATALPTIDDININYLAGNSSNLPIVDLEGLDERPLTNINLANVAINVISNDTS